MGKTRMTNQRIKILEYLQSVKTHPTAEMVYNAVKKDLPALSLGTVYRNLNLLADQGLICRMEVNNEFHFDACTDYHQHCVCKGCGNIFDMYEKDLSEYALKKVKLKEFTPLTVSIMYFGYCIGCKAKNT